MHLPRSQTVLVVLLLLALPITCGKQKDAPNNASAPDEAHTDSETKPTMDAPDSSQQAQSDPTADQENAPAETEQTATFKVGGMVTRLGMV
jgi:hypothetical protein